jgi:2,5-dihydroxypyridine 5,6-dioxygenase
MYQEFELGRGADILVRELFKLEPDETFLITADTESDFRIVAATARVAYAVGARPLVVWTATPKASGKAGEATWPVGALTAVLKEADAWAEFNRMAIFYSTPYDIAFAENKKLRHLCLVGMHSAMLSRCIAGTDFKLLGGFLEKIAQMTHKAKHVRITTSAGGDVEFDNKPEWPINTETGYADQPGSHMIPGQIGWAPDFDTVNGTIVFDGSVSKVPGLGILNQPIRLRVQKATITTIEGGREASMFESWLRNWNHPQMLRLAHVCYGFLPNAVLTGVIAEDERIWGSTQWGIGNVGPTAVPPAGMPAPSHMDGICLNSSVWLDGEPITADGKVVNPQLLSLAKALGK